MVELVLVLVLALVLVRVLVAVVVMTVLVVAVVAVALVVLVVMATTTTTTANLEEKSGAPTHVQWDPLRWPCPDSHRERGHNGPNYFSAGSSGLALRCFFTGLWKRLYHFWRSPTSTLNFSSLVAAASMTVCHDIIGIRRIFIIILIID